MFGSAGICADCCMEFAVEFEGGTHKSTETTLSENTITNHRIDVPANVLCAERTPRPAMLHALNEATEMETIPTIWEDERVALVLLQSAHYATTDGDTSEHNSSPQKRHNWSGSRQLGCTATPQHRDRDNTPEPDWHKWQKRSSSAERSTGTTSRGRPANLLLRRRGISTVHDSDCRRNRLKGALESAAAPSCSCFSAVLLFQPRTLCLSPVLFVSAPYSLSQPRTLCLSPVLLFQHRSLDSAPYS